MLSIEEACTRINQRVYHRLIRFNKFEHLKDISESFIRWNLQRTIYCNIYIGLNNIGLLTDKGVKYLKEQCFIREFDPIKKGHVLAGCMESPKLLRFMYNIFNGAFITFITELVTIFMQCYGSKK